MMLIMKMISVMIMIRTMIIIVIIIVTIIGPKTIIKPISETMSKNDIKIMICTIVRLLILVIFT